ncbi:hypothetical protein Acr_06g0008360 [Actinidia rufa]|uniref:Uncharacterized protein n=1 Tax=Actinidia rufa TaxID=165716 RepID=A0A7J0ERR7_9ERIC|nr:hypothetical protein Acr_06g0008360 [Actinidia rufa]
MSTPQKRKGSQTPASRRDLDLPSKRLHTRFGTHGATGSQQRADASSHMVTKFRPNSESHVADLDPPEAKVLAHAATDLQSSSTTTSASTSNDSRITDTIVSLFAHMDVIHKDLVEHIGQVHERVDLIVEHHAHDIKAVHDTLSALSHRHSEFITKVNDFI